MGMYESKNSNRRFNANVPGGNGWNLKPADSCQQWRIQHCHFVEPDFSPDTTDHASDLDVDTQGVITSSVGEETQRCGLFRRKRNKVVPGLMTGYAGGDDAHS